MTEDKDPGIGGPKLSKPGNTNLEERNKSYMKVLDVQNEYIQARHGARTLDEIREPYLRWKNKSAWHEKEFGW